MKQNTKNNILLILIFLMAIVILIILFFKPLMSIVSADDDVDKKQEATTEEAKDDPASRDYVFMTYSPDKGGEYFFFSTKARHKHSEVSYPDGAYIIFGKETRGIPEHVLMKYPDRCVRIPMIDEARSLNLANSVAVGCYEVLRQWDYPELLTKGELHRHHWEDTE